MNHRNKRNLAMIDWKKNSNNRCGNCDKIFFENILQYWDLNSSNECEFIIENIEQIHETSKQEYETWIMRRKNAKHEVFQFGT